MSKAVISKIIKWEGKEYAHIIEDTPNEFCDLCAFSELCAKVLTKELLFENTPMRMCSDICEEANTHYGFFIDASKAENYVKSVNSRDKHETIPKV